MLHRLFYLILFFLASFQISCKTVREVKSIESKGISDPLSDRFIGSSVSKYESGVRHSMDTKRTTTKKIFGGISKILFLQEDITKNLSIMEKQIIIQRINLILGIIILLKSEKQKLIKLYSLNADLAMQTKKLERVSGVGFLKERN